VKYLLDSNTISELYDTDASHHSAILGHLSALIDRDQVCISILSLYELEYGWANTPDEKKPAVRQVIADAQSDFEVLPLSVHGAVIFGELKKRIKELRNPSKENMKKFNVDLMLAATALTSDCCLVSADKVYRELQQYHTSFKFQDWTVLYVEKGA
jgi:predicted nucleic acid-binding protein